MAGIFITYIFQVSGSRARAAIVSNIYIAFAISHVKVYVSKIDLGVKYVKVILMSSFDQTMMGWSSRCYIPSFVEIGPPDLEIFEGFLPYMSLAVILVT